MKYEKQDSMKLPGVQNVHQAMEFFRERFQRPKRRPKCSALRCAALAQTVRKH